MDTILCMPWCKRTRPSRLLATCKRRVPRNLKAFHEHSESVKRIISCVRVLSTGGGGGGNSPKHSSFPPKTFSQIKSYNVLAKNLSAIPQLLGPQNCLRTTLSRLKTQNISGGACPQIPLENCSLWLQPPSTATFNIFSPKPKILARTLCVIYLICTLHPSCFHLLCVWGRESLGTRLSSVYKHETHGVVTIIRAMYLLICLDSES